MWLRGITDAEQVLEEQQIFRVGLRKSAQCASARGSGRQALGAGGGTHQPCDHVERDVLCMGSAVRGEHLDRRPAAIVAVSRTSRLLPIPGGPTTVTTHPAPPIGLVEDRGDGVEFPVATHE